MNIGFFTSIDDWGGSENYLFGLMQGVREQKHGVFLFGIQGTRLFKQCQEAGIECVAWRKLCPPSSVSNSQASENRPVRHLRSLGNPSKVMAKRLAPGWIKLFSGNRAQVNTLKNVFSAHPVDVMHINVHGYEMAGIACAGIGIPSLGMYCIMPEKESYWYRRRLIKKTVDSYDLVGGKSEACINAWMKVGKVSASKCVHIYNGIDMNRFSPKYKEGRNNKSFRLITVGRLHPMKGYEYLLRAMALIENPSITLTVVGTGPTEAELKKLVQDLGIEKRVIFWGYSDIPEELYRKHDCFVLPSVSHESFGSVLTEAMSCELPVITSDFGPFPEINIHNHTGLIVKQKNPEELAKAIGQLFDDSSLCEKLGQNGRKRVHKLFSYSQMVSTTLQVYQRLAFGGC